MNRLAVSSFTTIVTIFAMICGTSLYAQLGDGGDLGGLEDQIINDVNNNGGVGGGGGGDFGGGGGDAEGFDFGDLFGFGQFGDPSESTTNERDAAFVGSSIFSPQEDDEFRHVGPIRSSFGEAAAAAGGANQLGGRAGGPGQPGGGVAGNTNGFELPRQQTQLRSRIVPRFSSRPMAPAFVSRQVNQRFNQTMLRQSGMNANISVQGRTAIITGTAPTQQRARVLSRQLRFEPGISRVRNQMGFGR